MWAVGRHTFYSPTWSGSIFHWARNWARKLPAKYLSLGSGSGCTFFCQKLPERLWDLWGWLGHDPTPDRRLLQFPEQQHRTGRTYVLSDLDREASSSVCQWERSVTQTAWASCLAQAVTRSTSFSSKLITTQNKPPPLVFKRSNREWGKKRHNKDRSQTQDIGSASSSGYLGAQFSWGHRITEQRWCLTSPDTSKSHQVRRELVNLNYFLLGHCSSLLGLVLFQRTGLNGSVSHRKCWKFQNAIYFLLLGPNQRRTYRTAIFRHNSGIYGREKIFLKNYFESIWNLKLSLKEGKMWIKKWLQPSKGSINSSRVRSSIREVIFTAPTPPALPVVNFIDVMFKRPNQGSPEK